MERPETSMENPAAREHDFGSKLRQDSVVKRLQDYVCWQRNVRTHPDGDTPRLRSCLHQPGSDAGL